MLLVLVSLLCCVSVAKSCLQCDSKVKRLNEELVLSAPTLGEQIEIKGICDHAYVTYKETSMQQMGVIDPTTLYRARTEYESEFDQFLKANHTESLPFEVIQMMEKGKKILEKHLAQFTEHGLCPNTCGLLIRRVIDCISCKFKKHTCPSLFGQQDCKEHQLQAEEGGQAVLNCFLPWHRLLLGKPEYHYYWAPGLLGNIMMQLNETLFTPLVVTDDSSLILNQLHVGDQGTYRCYLQQNGIVFYQVRFLLTVTPLPNQTHRPLVTLPTLLHGDDYSPFQQTEHLLVPIVAMVTALSLAASVVLTVLLGILMNPQRSRGV